jgi:hypothetical protein
VRSLPDGPPALAIVLRAVLYALAIVLLVLYGPREEHRFIYQGF